MRNLDQRIFGAWINMMVFDFAPEFWALIILSARYWVGADSISAPRTGQIWNPPLLKTPV
jgi:hypothetical protein